MSDGKRTITEHLHTIDFEGMSLDKMIDELNEIKSYNYQDDYTNIRVVHEYSMSYNSRYNDYSDDTEYYQAELMGDRLETDKEYEARLSKDKETRDKQNKKNRQWKEDRKVRLLKELKELG